MISFRTKNDIINIQDMEDKLNSSLVGTLLLLLL